MSKHLVLAGAGHAHLTLLARLAEITAEGHRVTVIGPSSFHYYSGMGPGLLGGLYAPEQIRFASEQTVINGGGTFLRDKVVRVDPERKILFLAGGDTVAYDLLSLNVGSFVPDTLLSGSREGIFPVKPIENLLAARQLILRELAAAGSSPVTVAVVGGGPAAAEIAGNARDLAPAGDRSGLTVHLLAGDGLLKEFPDAVRRRVRRVLTRRGVTIEESGFVREVETGRVTRADGRTLAAEVILLAPGIKPSPLLADSRLPVGPDGDLRVNAFLQCPAYPEIFGGGDCVYFEPAPLPKVGVYATRQNPVLFDNLRSALAGTELRPFHPGGGYLIIFNLGGRVGVLRKGWLTAGGRLAFRLKDWIDRRFMARFQIPEQAATS